MTAHTRSHRSPGDILKRREAVVGSVISGLLSRGLLSRILSGFIAAHFGWRTMLVLGIPLVLEGAFAMALMLPLSLPVTSIGYASLLQCY